MNLLASTLLMALAGQSAPVEDPRLLRCPDVRGETIVFQYAGDLWVSDLKGSLARRLTSHPGLETRPKISPDGKTVAFTGEYDGNPDVFVVPIEGGEPKRLTFEPVVDEVIGWSPDGRVMYTSNYGNPQFQQRMLYLVKPTGGISERTKVYEISEGSYSADMGTLAYTRANSYRFTWRRYRGGTQGRISVWDLKSNKYRELPTGREQNYFPMVVGDDVLYISDKKLGTLNLYRHDLKTGREVQLTKYADADIRYPSTDGKNVVYERDGYLYRYDLATNKDERLDPKIRFDGAWSRPTLRRLGNEIREVDLSPSGNRIAVEARGEIFSLPARSGEVRNLTNTQDSREQHPAWSPDGKTIAYVSDKSGETEIYTIPQMGGDATQLTTAKLPIQGLTWSPDSKAIVFVTTGNEIYRLEVESKKLTQVLKPTQGIMGLDISPDGSWIVSVTQTANGFGRITLIETATNKATVVGDGAYSDTQPIFDQNGKYLYFVSNRTFNPGFGAFEMSLKIEDAARIYVVPLTKDLANPLIPAGDEEPGGAPAPAKPAEAAKPAEGAAKPTMKIDLDGFMDRAIPLPMPAANYGLVAGVNGGIIYRQGPALFRFDLSGREPTPLGAIPGAISLNPARTKLGYYAGGTLGIVDLRPGLQPGQGRVETTGVEMIADPRKEWRQMYWEAWRFMRDNYYDPQMRGLDWNAIGKRYEGYLKDAGHRSDLDLILGLMIGELGTGHAYVQSPVGPVNPIPVGLLGADYKFENGKVRFEKIFRGSNYDEARRAPLGDASVNVNEGDYLLAIDGAPVTDTVSPNSLMVGKAGRFVTLTVNDKPTMEGARKVRVRTVASEQPIRYVDFVERSRAYVEKASGGRIGYFHVPNTATEGAIEFVRGFYAQSDKDALIIDERWNGGGFLPNYMAEMLVRRTQTRLQQRNGGDVSDVPAVDGPKVMLINEYAGSGGDMFPYLFRKMGGGQLIGRRTWGGLVGITGGAPLLDGGGVTAPEFSIFDPNTNTIVAENTGIDPDIDIDARPDLIAAGQDPQLERAVRHLLDQLAKMPKKPVRTTIPRVGDKGRVGG